ncbi:MAG: hypothetical protein IPJ65_24145 [Archangiaceae bacterium]|nr:hypothetical protein [Archangiaceae bacterium]
MRRARGPRGQNLALLALTMLLVTLMVLITLGIAQRIRENHELNDLADAAAYSSAVANARAFNDIAIINRLQVSYWVSMAANESLISWTSYARGLWNASIRNLDGIEGKISSTWLPPTACGKVRADAHTAAQRLRASFVTAMAGWEGADIAAGIETKDIQSVIATLRAETRGDPTDNQLFPDGMKNRLFDERKTQSLAKRIVMESGLTDVTVVPPLGGPTGGAAGVSSREVGDYGLGLYTDCESSQTGLCNGATPGSWSEAVVEAAMGTRGNPFTLVRGVRPPIVDAAWAQAATNLPWDSNLAFGDGTPLGSAYWSTTASGGADASPVFAWADDRGSLTTTMRSNTGGCATPHSTAAGAHVKTTDEIDTSDQHDWFPDDVGMDHDQIGIPEKYHTVGDCTPLCPSVWVRQVHFHPARGKPEDAYGQPKSVVMLVRDTALAGTTRQPWKLDFRFFFSGAGSRFDNRGQQLHTASLGGALPIAHQGAVATAMTYYHRKDTWREYPNLLNPFWRATLVAADIDEGSRDDLASVLSRPAEAWQGGAYDALLSAGYRGLH